jgi:hypothetical protein
MRFALMAFYGGPDQVMTVTSGLASLLGLLLIFWNKLVATFFKIVRIFRPANAQPANPEVQKNTPNGSP